MSYLIDNHSFKCVIHGIYVREPLEPRTHVLKWHRKPTIDSQKRSEQGSGRLRASQSSRKSAHGSVNDRPIEKTHESKKIVREEGARCPAEVAQEVEGKIEDEG